MSQNDFKTSETIQPQEASPMKHHISVLDVRFTSSLPVMQGNVYKAWVDSKPVQMVRAGD
jgi:hypothetical protein